MYKIVCLRNDVGKFGYLYVVEFELKLLFCIKKLI